MKTDTLIEEARILVKRGEISKGYSLFEQAAIQGNAEAQFEYGNAIIHGIVERPLEEGVIWLHKAVNQNYLLAINNLALCYQQGKGVPMDERKAFSLLIKALFLGDIMAAFNVGQAYFYGLGVERDLSKAIEHITRASKANCVNAIYMLGQIYEKGDEDDNVIIPANIEQAIIQYRKAATIGFDKAIQSLKRLNCQFSIDPSSSFMKEEGMPSIALSYSGEVLIRADIVSPDSSSISDGNYITANNAVTLLYLQAKHDSNSGAIEWLFELSYSYLNKLAFNALNELGQMADVTDDNTRFGYAQLMLDSWVKCNREMLELIAFLSYPTFSYSEFDQNNNLLRLIPDNHIFVDYLMDEIEESHKKKQVIQARIRSDNGDFVVDVMNDDRLSIFKLLFGERTFLGINRYRYL